jgi:hypothetical protein
MELDLNKGKTDRGIENPLSAIFDLAEDVNEYSKYVKKMIWYAIIFMAFWVFFNLLMIIIFLGSGNLIPVPLFIGLFLSGIIAFILVMRTHKFFKYFTKRYEGIKTVRENDDLVKIPKGATIEDRFYSYISMKHPAMQELIKRNPKALKHNTRVKGKSGHFYDFEFYLNKPSEGILKIFGMGEPGYGLFIKKYKGRPKMADILDLKNAMKDIAEAEGMAPSRIVMLYKYPSNFKGLNDDLYSFLTRDEFRLEVKGETCFPIIQVVGETDEGYYDFTPMVPEFAERLP